MLKIGKIQGWPINNIEDLHTPIREFSDMCSFVEAGIPSTWIWETSITSIHPYYHTEKDVIDFIDLDKFVQTLDVNGLLVHNIANIKHVPKSEKPLPTNQYKQKQIAAD